MVFNSEKITDNRILVIPSWLYYKHQPWGSYFIDQADFLNSNSNIEINVLFGREKSRPLIEFIFDFIYVFIFRSVKIFKSPNSKETEVYEFLVPKNRRIPDQIYLSFVKRKYYLAFIKFKSLKWTPKLIHSQSGMDASIYVQYISNKFKIPYVITEHQVFTFHYYSMFKAKLILDSFKGANKTAAVSYAERREVLMNQPFCNPVIIPNLVNEEKFQLKIKIDSPIFHIVTVMYANPIKGYETFFQAVSMLKNISSNIRFTVVGDGILNGENVFEKLCNDLQIKENVSLVSRIERENISNIFYESDLYVCSSDFESFGIAPREAMMCGIPVVSTANGGLEDIISPETGIIVPIKDPRSLVDAILKVKNKEVSFDPIKIRALVINHCGREAFKKAMINFYQLN